MNKIPLLKTKKSREEILIALWVALTLITIDTFRSLISWIFINLFKINETLVYSMGFIIVAILLGSLIWLIKKYSKIV